MSSSQSSLVAVAALLLAETRVLLVWTRVLLPRDVSGERGAGETGLTCWGAELWSSSVGSQTGLCSHHSLVCTVTIKKNLTSVFSHLLKTNVRFFLIVTVEIYFPQMKKCFCDLIT